MPLDRRTVLRGLIGVGALAAVGRVDAARGAAEDGVAWPAIVPRTAWDPDGTCEPRVAPELGPPVRRVVVHHTQIFADHQPEDVPDLLRDLCGSHVRERGFDDLGYHLLIDRTGVVHEGRAGGVSRPVVGAHAQGFNHGTVGVALLGDHQRDPVPDAARRALARTIGWLAVLHGFDPRAVSPHVSTGGPSSRHETGVTVDLPAILAHRTVGTTSCPGRHLLAYVRSGDLLTDVLASLDGMPSQLDAATGPADGSPGDAGTVERVVGILERLLAPPVPRP